MKNSFLIILLILCTACLKKDTEIPDGVLSKDQMVSVLIDVHLLEAKLKKLYLEKDSARKVYDHYEKLIFLKQGIDAETYEKSMEFYVEEIEEMKEIYNQVVDSLLARQKTMNFD